MSDVIEKFLSYVVVDTQSEDDLEQIPSTEKQRTLAGKLAGELKSMGASDVTVDAHSYVYASIPATTEQEVPVLGFVAHMDTSPDYSGADVKPQIIRRYDGGDIVLNQEKNIVMSVRDFPYLTELKGQDLITTDGTTLLGADDKAGVAEIMAMAEYLLSHPEIPHGTIKIGFTPDEEVGHGADLFDVAGFGAEVAYTVDGGSLGELEYENFNAASAKITIHGTSIHPGSSKGKMKNAILIGQEFHAMLPAFENPMYTEGYEGFYHLHDCNGTVEFTELKYLIRDHDREKFEDKKDFMLQAAALLNRKYGEGVVEVELEDSYYNMKRELASHMYLIHIAEEAMEDAGVTPLETPIRGGTDGARLSYMGLPCPNLCTGGYHFHGRYEFIPVQSMEKVVEILIRIVEKFTEQRKA